MIIGAQRLFLAASILSQINIYSQENLLNRLNISIDGRDLQFKIAQGKVTGNNFPVAVQQL